MGVDFLAEVRSSIERALNNPEAFPRFRDNPTVRRVLTRRFPYRFFFIVRPDAMVVFAVLHAARQDRTWKHRIRKL